MNPSFTRLYAHGTTLKPQTGNLRGGLVRRKNFNRTAHLLAFLFIFFIPDVVKAQCNCADNTPAATLLEVRELHFATGGAINLNVPQFDPSLGTLICVNAKIYLTSAFRFRLENEAPREVEYHVPYLRFDSLLGPGINPPVGGMRMKEYGPILLQAADEYPNSGPDYYMSAYDTVYNNVLYEGTTTNVVDYLGDGEVAFQYKSRVFTNAEGSDSNQLGVGSVNRLRFEMTYSYCPEPSVLSQNIKNFNATLKSPGLVLISWTTQNESKNNNYEIQLSQDGRNFEGVGATRAHAVEGIAAKYEYQYYPDRSSDRKLYFRIRQQSGKSIAYSEIKSVSLNGGTAQTAVRVFPNPAVRDIQLQFDEPLSGDLQIQIRNQMGQIFHATRLKVQNSTVARMQLPETPAAGVYYLTARDIRSEKTFVTRLLLTR